MNTKTLELCKKLVPETYIGQASGAQNNFEKKVQILIEQQKWPEEGWSEQWIEKLIGDLAMMDSNNFSKKCQIGEREGRVLSDLVAKRHYRLIHGIGRSGFLTQVQPKAAGSSLIMKITNQLVTDVLKQLGLTAMGIVVPMATGMSMMMCLLSLKKSRPQASMVLWSRIDQKSCIKSILSASFTLKVVETRLEGDEVTTDLEGMERCILEVGEPNILCIITTTSCFAPRASDKVEEVAVICKQHNIPHLVNNAYGLQSPKCTHLIQQAHRVGRVDLVVQSTDKNFLVPVGGAIIASFDPSLIENICSFYPGRASINAHLDLLMTLLSVGSMGFKRMLKERKELFDYLTKRLQEVATNFKQRVLSSPNNKISIGMTLDDLPDDDVTQVGSMLFKRLVSGARVVKRGTVSKIEGVEFKGFGASHSNYPHHYLTTAASIGITKKDIDTFAHRLSDVLKEVSKKQNKSTQAVGDTASLDSNHATTVPT